MQDELKDSVIESTNLLLNRGAEIVAVVAIKEGALYRMSNLEDNGRLLTVILSAFLAPPTAAAEEMLFTIHDKKLVEVGGDGEPN